MIPTARRDRRAVFAALILCVSFGLEAARAQEAPTRDRFAIPATDEGLPGAGPIRRYDWFQKVWRSAARRGPRGASRTGSAVVFLGDSITQGWGDGLRRRVPRSQGRQSRHRRRHHARRAPETPGRRARAGPGGGGAADRHQRPRGGRDSRDHRRQPAPDPGRPQAAQPADADRALPGLPELGDEEAAGGPDQGPQRALSGGDQERPAGHAARHLALFADAGGDAIAAEFPDLLHPNEAGYAKWAAALRPVFATLGFIETTAEPFTPDEGSSSCSTAATSPAGATVRPRTPTRRAPGAGGLRPERRGLAVRHRARAASTAWPRPPTAAFAAINGRLVVTTPPEGRKIQQLWTTREFPATTSSSSSSSARRRTPTAASTSAGRSCSAATTDSPAPTRTLTRYKPQDWNELVVTVQNGVATATSNGEPWRRSSRSPPSGPIGLEGDRGQMEYRRLQIKTTPPRP